MDSIYDGLDLPDEAWRDDQEESFDPAPPQGPSLRLNGVAWYWWCVGTLLAVALVAGTLGLG